jgi:D-alanyl-D-alanine dipeptidase
MNHGNRLILALAVVVVCSGCRQQTRVSPRPLIDSSEQLVVVTTPAWTSTTGSMLRFERASSTSAWRSIDRPEPVVVGRTGIAWGVGFDGVLSEGPHKEEGDGKSPAGIFPLDTVFGFAPRNSLQRVRLPYVQLVATTDCVDDVASTHYNTVVDRMSVARVDWTSAEHMREVGQYEIGVIVGCNVIPPIKGRGSCIFLHIWTGPRSHTAGCTAFDEAKLREVVSWLDPKKRPMLVQLTAIDYANLRTRWSLP